MAFSFGKMNDPDATLFIQVSELTGSTERGAIVDLVKDLKSNNLWSKMKAIYPFVGGTATTHKWNLKDPRDLDVAFRLTFSGGWTHSNTGVKGNGSNAYANTYFIPSSQMQIGSGHSSFYSRTNVLENSLDYGYANAGSTNFLQVGARYNVVSPDGTTLVYFYSSITAHTIGNKDSRGMFVQSRSSTSALSSFQNNVKIGSSTNTQTSGFSGISGNLSIGGRNYAETVDSFSTREYAFFSFGDGLTDADAANLYTIVQKYQTTLGRQV